MEARSTGMMSRAVIETGDFIVNMEQQQKAMKKQNRDYQTYNEVAADQKQRSHGMSERMAQQIHVRSLFLGTAVRDGSLHSAYSRTQTGRFESSAWYPNSGTTTTIEAEQATLNGDWGNAHMGSTNGKSNRFGLRST